MSAKVNSESAPLELTVIIPALNECESLRTLLLDLSGRLREVFNEAFEIIVVNDGSSDGTLQMLASLNEPRMQVVTHAISQGSGAARKMGSRRARAEWCAWIDADGTYLATDLIHAFQQRDDADQIIGRRNVDYGRYALVRINAKRLVSRLASLLWRRDIPDLNSGLRIFRRSSMLTWLQELPDGFSCTSTATLAALNHRQKVSFIPISYLPRENGSHSKFHPLLDTLRLCRAVGRCYLRK